MKLILNTLFVLIISINSFAQNTENEWLLYRDSAVNETNGQKSLVYSNKLLEISLYNNNHSQIAASYIEIAHDYNRLGNYSIALKNALLAYEYLKIENDTSNGDNSIFVYSLIGNVYGNLKNYEKSNEYYDKSIKESRKKRSLNTLIPDYTNKGENFRLMKQYDSALTYFMLADSLYHIINATKRKIALSNCNLGLAYLGLNNFEKADSLLQLAFDYYIPNKSYYAVCISYYELAKKELERNNIAKAKSYVSDMLDMAFESNITDQLRDGHLLMYDIAILEQNYETANLHLKQHYTLKDSLINNKVVSQMAEQRAEFEINQKQVEVDHFKAISKARTTMVTMLSVGLFLIFGLAIFLYLINKKRKAANIELVDKNHIIELALEEKDVLMKEIHHRVKNNLQIISSIISLQSMHINDKDTQVIFSEMQRRISAISSLHQKLYQGESLSHINMREYLGEVVESIHTAFTTESLNVIYEIAIQHVRLNVDAAVSIGLIVNELTTNAYKYAFKPNYPNQFMVALSKRNNGCLLQVYDNGIGIPDDKDILNSNSLGLRMVNLLSRQLKGQLSYESNNGAQFSILFEEMSLE